MKPKMHLKPEDKDNLHKKRLIQATKKAVEQTEGVKSAVENLEESFIHGTQYTLDKLDEVKEVIENKEIPTKMAVRLEGVSLIQIKGDKGKDGESGQDGYTPVKDIDYFDGKDGLDGADGKDGVDGKDGRDGKDGINGLDGQDGKPGKDGSPDTPDEVVEKVNRSQKKIEPKQVKGMLQLIQNLDEVSARRVSGGGVSSSYIIKNNGTKVSDFVTELDFTDNLTAIYASNGKVTIASTGGGAVGPGTENELAYFNTTTSIASLPVATYPSLTELSRVKGVTSAIQTQIDSKVSDTGDTMTGDLLMATDKRIKLNTNLPTSTAVGLIQLKFNDNEAKAILAYVDENDNEVIWLQAHNYLTFPGNQHKHFSIEASDAAGLKQTRFSVSYGADTNVVNVNAADFYVAGTGGIRTIDSDFDGILKLTPATTFDIYPQGGSTYGLRTALANTDEITLSAIGSSYIYLNDGLMINTASGGDYASLLRFGGEGASNFQGGYIQYDASGNEFIIGTHNTADELNASDVEVIRINRAGTLVTSTAPLTLGVSNSLTAGSIELGHASDTTITRTGAGDIAVEGNTLYRAGGTDVPVADGGTGASTASAAFDNLKQAASATATGVVELATDAETVTGTDTARATTPANITAKMAAPGAIGGTTPGVATFTTVTVNTGITLAENASIALDPAGSADGKYSGITIAGTAGTALAFGNLVYLAVADSRWELTDADAASTSGDVQLGMCVLAAAADGDPTVILLYGNIRADATFPALTVGAPAYVSTTAGAIQTAQPSGTDDVIRRVGFALTADELMFNPSNDYITHT